MVVLLALCIFPGQLWITKQFPGISGLAQINPSLVFLDIPIHLPVAIDLILVPGLFLLAYPLVILFYPLRPGILSWRQSLQRIRAAFLGLFILLCCTLLGGLIYYLAQDHLPMQIKNGINSLGFIADIHLSYPGHETIYLRGSLVLLVCFIIGLVICIRKISKEPGSQLTREQRMTPYQRMLQEKKEKIMQERQMMEEAERRIGGYHPEKSRKPVVQEQVMVQPDHHGQSQFCFSQPVKTFRPEAIYFMPGR
jgi:hypothetical protein